MRRFAAILAMIVIASCPLSAQKSSGAKDLDRIRKEISDLDRQIKANDSKSANATAQLTLTRKKIAAEKQLVEASGKQLDSIKKEMALLDKEISSLKKDYDTNSKNFEEMIKRLYPVRDNRLWMLYVLNGNNLPQIARRYSYLKNVSQGIRNESSRLSQKQAELQNRYARLDSMKTVSAEIAATRKGDLEKLRAAEKKNTELISKLNREKASYQKSLSKKKSEAEALSRKVNEVVKKDAATKKNKSTSSAASTKSSFAKAKGDLPWPVEGTVTALYGQHNHPVYKNVALPFNNGINIATDASAQVKAVYEGTVKNVAVMPGYNQCVLVQHGEYYTFYCGLKDVRVKAGEKISAGKVVGLVDTISGETQLHFQLWKGTQSQDPQKWLR